jgi:hypothetical protein
MVMDPKQDLLVHGYVRRYIPALEESMKNFLQEELQAIEKSLRSLVVSSVQTTETPPEGKVKGMVRYAVFPWDPLGNAFEGLVVYNGTSWVAV